MPDLTSADIDHRFDYHAPTPSKQDVHEQTRAAYKRLALGLINIPDSRERSLAYTALEESLMWANAAIARNT
jgi:hypothetical protein